MPYLDKTLSIFIAAYRERYGTHHVLIRLIEDWRLKLDTDQKGAFQKGAQDNLL